ncbi:MAG TPA: C4-type zinc ribbon domain-containing protein [Pyrinomonadaceae bacterium]|nr:C4-type zinc ribbon domain-containing protein [Pyrinomonadaceae bacterium]
MKAELTQLIDLQNLDTSIRRLKAELEAIPHRRAEIEREFEQRAAEFLTLENRRDEARQTRTRLETELAETRIKAEHADRALMAATNEKEYTAAIREGDAARKHGSELETKILEQMETFDGAEQQIKERTPEIEILRDERDVQLAALEAQAQAQAQQIEAQRAERERVLASLPKQMGALYNRISARVRDGIAVAEARNNSCSACHMRQRPQVMTEIRRGAEIITCDNCARILYYVADTGATQAATT